MFESIIAQLLDLLRKLLTLQVLLQLGALLVVLVLMRLLERPINRVLEQARARIEGWPALKRFPWILDGVPLLKSIVAPLTGWALGSAVIGIFHNLGQSSAILEWVVPFFALWLVYRLTSTFVQLRMPPAQAQVWSRQILRPLFLLIAVLIATGLLDDILALGIRPTEAMLITLKSLLAGLVVFYLFLFLSRNMRDFLRNTFLPRAGIAPTLNQVLTTITSYAILLTGAFLGLSIAGIDLSSAALILGGLSVGIGFGLQHLINNFISGFILLFEQTIVPGDIIEVSGNVGVVTGIGLRTTRLQTADQVELIIPNGQLFENVVTSYTHGSRRTGFHVQVSTRPSTDPHVVVAALLEAAKHPEVLAEPAPAVLLTDSAGWRMKFDLSLWVDDPTKVDDVASDVRFKIWDIFQARGI